MRFRTLARDCLYLNWSLPRQAAPPLPAPLRYEEHACGGEEHVFVSALLFRLTEMRLGAVPGGRLSYPQANVRVYVRDDRDRPAAFYLRTLVPLWVMPGARVLGRQPVEVARLRYPRPLRHRDAESWRWQVGRRGRDDVSLAVSARLEAPRIGPGPRLGPWERTVAYFRQRPETYVLDGDRLRAVDAAHASIDIWPLAAEVTEAGLLADTLPEAPSDTWTTPHSAWLCPEIPFRFELGTLAGRALSKRAMPAAEGA